MKIVFFYSDLKPREIDLLNALKKGASRHGDIVEGVPTHEYSLRRDAHVASIFGVKGHSRVLLREYTKVGIYTLYIDKGYTRCCKAGRDQYKLVLDNFNRKDIGSLGMPDDRLKTLKGHLVDYNKYSRPDAPIIITGSSAKFHEFAGLSNPTVYVKDIAKKLNKITQRPIIYRPKPSWRDAEPIMDLEYSRPPQSLQDLFNRKPHAVITYGSNAGVDAVFAGVPVISLTDLCVTHNISSHELADIEAPYIPRKTERYQWLSDLAYQQWSLKEIAAGQAWDYYRQGLKP